MRQMLRLIAIATVLVASLGMHTTNAAPGSVTNAMHGPEQDPCLPVERLGTLYGSVKAEGSGLPVARVSVELWTASPTMGAATLISQTQTDASGAYTFATPINQRFVVFFLPTHQTPGFLGRAHLPDYPLKTRAEVYQASIDVLDATPVKVPDVSVALYRYAIEGRVLDRDTGKPIAGLRLLPDGWAQNTPAPLWNRSWLAPLALSGSNGAFRIGVPSSGEYAVAIEPERDLSGGLPGYVGLALLRTTDRTSAPQEIQALSRERSRTTLTGQVVDDATGQPVPNATIMNTDSATSHFGASAVTDADGRWKINTQSGRQHLRIFGPKTANLDFGYRPVHHEFNVKGAAGVYEVNTRLTRAPIATGRIVSLRGDPLDDIEITLRRADGMLISSARSDVQGTYWLPTTGAGQYSILVEQQQIVPYRSQMPIQIGATLARQPQRDHAIDVKSLVRVVGRIAGTSMPATGQHFRVSRVSDTDDDQVSFVLDAEGRAVLPLGEIGLFQIESPQISATISMTSAINEIIDVSFEIPAGPNGTFVTGRIVDAETGRAVQGALVSMSNGADPVGGYTDQTGRYLMHISTPNHVTLSVEGVGTLNGAAVRLARNYFPGTQQPEMLEVPGGPVLQLRDWPVTTDASFVRFSVTRAPTPDGFIEYLLPRSVAYFVYNLSGAVVARAEYDYESAVLGPGAYKIAVFDPTFGLHFYPAATTFDAAQVITVTGDGTDLSLNITVPSCELARNSVFLPISQR
jgi:5-hydroxyisourate hydrolase-like protein (transthyretin family)